MLAAPRRAQVQVGQALCDEQRGHVEHMGQLLQLHLGLGARAYGLHAVAQHGGGNEQAQGELVGLAVVALGVVHGKVVLHRNQPVRARAQVVQRAVPQGLGHGVALVDDGVARADGDAGQVVGADVQAGALCQGVAQDDGDAHFFGDSRQIDGYRLVPVKVQDAFCKQGHGPLSGDLQAPHANALHWRRRGGQEQGVMAAGRAHTGAGGAGALTRAG